MSGGKSLRESCRVASQGHNRGHIPGSHILAADTGMASAWLWPRSLYQADEHCLTGGCQSARVLKSSASIVSITPLVLSSQGLLTKLECLETFFFPYALYNDSMQDHNFPYFTAAPLQMKGCKCLERASVGQTDSIVLMSAILIAPRLQMVIAITHTTGQSTRC